MHADRKNKHKHKMNKLLNIIIGCMQTDGTSTSRITPYTLTDPILGQPDSGHQIFGQDTNFWFSGHVCFSSGCVQFFFRMCLFIFLDMTSFFFKHVSQTTLNLPKLQGVCEVEYAKRAASNLSKFLHNLFIYFNDSLKSMLVYQ